MKKFNLKILFSIILLGNLFSCFKEQKKTKKLDAWEKIQNAVTNENIEYLLKISDSTLQCIECENGKSKVTKELFYKKHINQIKQEKKLNYIVYTDTVNTTTKRHRITYHKRKETNIV